MWPALPQLLPEWTTMMRKCHIAFGHARLENGQEYADIQQAHAIIVATPESERRRRSRTVLFDELRLERKRSNSIHVDCIQQALLRDNSHHGYRRVQSEEPVDIKRDGGAQEYPPHEANRPPRGELHKEVYSLVDEEEALLLSRDRPWEQEENGLIRDAQRAPKQDWPDLHEIVDLWSEHEKQRRNSGFYPQLQADERYSRLGSMGKTPNISGPKPVNRLGEHKEAHISADWPKSVGGGTSRGPGRPRTYAPFNAAPLQNNSSSSPINIDMSPAERQVLRSTPRSGYSQTLNDSHKQNTLKAGRPEEYLNVEHTIDPKFTRPRKRSGGTLMNGSRNNAPPKFAIEIPFQEPLEISGDPIEDSEGVIYTRISARKAKVSNSSDEIRQHKEEEPVQGHKTLISNGKGRKASGNKSEGINAKTTDEISPHFTKSSADGKESAPPVSRQAAQKLIVPLKSDGPVVEVSKSSVFKHGNDHASIDPDTSIDELAADQAHKKRAEQLLGKKLPVNLEKSRKRQAPIHIDHDSDELASNHDSHDIPLTQFGSKKRQKRAQSSGVYEICQLFSHEDIRLITPNSGVWTLRLDKENDQLQVKDGRGNALEPVPYKSFHQLEYHEDSTKVIIHKHRTNEIHSSRIFVEFSGPTNRGWFVDDMRLVSRVTAIEKSSSQYLDKVFSNMLNAARKQLDSHHPSDQGDGRKFRQPSQDDPEDVQLAKVRTQKKLAPLWDTPPAKSERSSVPGKASTASNTQAPRRKLVDLMQSEAHQAKPEQTEISQAEFYGRNTRSSVGSGAAHGTRSSTRGNETSIAPKRRAQREPSPPPPQIPKWSVTNPHWAKEYKWKSPILYPFIGKKKANVEKEDICRLDEDEFLNDNLIAFYLRYLEHNLETSDPELAKKVYFHNSFFYEKLSTHCKRGSLINYDAIARWTAKINIFDYDYIIVPVNESYHWYVAIIYNAKKLLETATPLRDDTNPSSPQAENESGLTPQTNHLTIDLSGDSGGEHDSNKSPPPVVSDIVPSSAVSTQKEQSRTRQPRKYSTDEFRIITLDSFGQGRSPVVRKLKQYLIEEAATKLNLKLADAFPNGMTAHNIPQQLNSSDCGLFLLSYVEMLLKKPDAFIKSILHKTNDLMGEYRDTSKMRDEFRNLLFDLQKQQHGGGKPGVEHHDTKSVVETKPVQTQESSRHSDAKGIPNSGRQSLDDEEAKPPVENSTDSHPNDAGRQKGPSGAQHKTPGLLKRVGERVGDLIGLSQNTPPSRLRTKGTTSKQVVEIDDSQEPLSQSSSEVTDQPPPQNVVSLSESRQARNKVAVKSKAPGIDLVSPTPSVTQGTIDWRANKESIIKRASDSVPQLGSPNSSVQGDGEGEGEVEDDEVELIQPFQTDQDTKTSDSEMLLSNGDQPQTNLGQEAMVDDSDLPRDLISKASIGSPKVLDRLFSTDSDEKPGKKRKTPVDEDQSEHRSRQPPHTRSSPASEASEMTRLTPTNKRVKVENQPKRSTPPSGRFAKRSKLVINGSISKGNTIAVNGNSIGLGQPKKPAFTRDSLDEAMMAAHNGKS